jgi:hypothetical protein
MSAAHDRQREHLKQLRTVTAAERAMATSLAYPTDSWWVGLDSTTFRAQARAQAVRLRRATIAVRRRNDGD